MRRASAGRHQYLGGRLAAGLIALVLALTVPLSAQPAATGSVEGRVQNVVTGEALNNARVTVKGTALMAFTDEGGVYRLNEVPAGPVTLRVFFTGLDEQENTLTVAAGQTALQDFKLTSKARYGTDADTVRLDAFLVESTKETNAAAIAVNEQRFARNIKSVVSADEFGVIPDSNPGELMKWLPGVGVQYFANNITGVDVRGLGSVNTEISFDGMPVASANTESMGRGFEMKGASASDIARVEIRKLPLPEDSSNALGGSINMVRRSAFEFSRRTIEYRGLFTADGELLTLKERPGPKDRQMQYWRPNWEVKWTEPVNKNFGFAVTVGQNDAIVRTHWANPGWNYGSSAQRVAAEAAMAAGQPLTTISLYNPANTNMLLHDAPIRDARDYATARLDWRPTSELTLAYSLSYTKYYNQTADDIRYTWNTAATGSGDPRYVDQHTLLGRIGGGQIFYNTPLWRDINNPTTSHSVEARWKRGDWTLSARGAYSFAKFTYTDAEDGFFNSTTAAGIANTGIGSGTANPMPITVNFYDQGYRGPQRIEALDANNAPIDWAKAATARIGGARSRPGMQTSIVAATRLFAKRDFNFRNPLSVQLGFDFSDTFRNTRYATNIWQFVGPDGLPGTADDTAAQIAAVNVRPSGDSISKTPAIEHISLSRLYKLYQDHPEYFQYQANQSFRNTVNQPFQLSEKTYAPYLQFFQSLFSNRLTLAGGLRFERSEATGRGFLQNQSAAYQKYSDGTVKHAGDVLGTNGLPVSRAGTPVYLPGITSGSYEEALLTMKAKGASGQGSNQNYFPSLHLTYNITDKLQFQGGYAKTQARNQYARTVIPATTTSDTTQSDGAAGVINIRNADLKPWVGDNYEARLSYYTSTGGVFGVGVFTKRIKNYQVSNVDLLTTPAEAAVWGFGPEYVGYDVSTFFNQGSARIDGAEFEMRQNLDPLLPAWAKGFEISASFNYTNLKGQPAGGTSGDFGNLVDDRYPIFLRYSRKRFSANIGFIYNGRLVNQADSAAGVNGTRVTLPQKMIDFNASYAFSKRAQIFISGRNINKEWRNRERQFPGAPNWGALQSSNNLGTTFTVGITGTY